MADSVRQSRVDPRPEERASNGVCGGALWVLRRDMLRIIVDEKGIVGQSILSSFRRKLLR